MKRNLFFPVSNTPLFSISLFLFSHHLLVNLSEVWINTTTSSKCNFSQFPVWRKIFLADFSTKNFIFQIFQKGKKYRFASHPFCKLGKADKLAILDGRPCGCVVRSENFRQHFFLLAFTKKCKKKIEFWNQDFSETQKSVFLHSRHLGLRIKLNVVLMAVSFFCLVWRFRFQTVWETIALCHQKWSILLDFYQKLLHIKFLDPRTNKCPPSTYRNQLETSAGSVKQCTSSFLDWFRVLCNETFSPNSRVFCFLLEKKENWVGSQENKVTK